VNVDITLELRDAHNRLIAQDNSSTSQEGSIIRDIPKGLYHVVVRNNGAYGELGKYTLTGTGISSTGYRSAGPSVVYSGPQNQALEPFTRGPVSMIVTFDKPIDIATLTTDDVTFVSPSGRRTHAYRIDLLPGQHGTRSFRIQAHLPEYGTYRMEIGPFIHDQFGNAMDQDHDGVNGEASADRYSTIAVTRLMPTLGNIAPTLSRLAIPSRQGTGSRASRAAHIRGLANWE
jgi:hypothetical protein